MTSACSVLSEALGEPLAGTAAVAQTWLCIEQPGPYGREALTESHLDPALGAELGRRAAGTGVRITLIRRPGHHADKHASPSPRRIFLAHTGPGVTWLERTVVDDPQALLDLDLAAAGAGAPPHFGARDDRPLLLVCTNARRDVCCALYGRPVATGLAERHGDAVWECTHTGGHRFAPTGVLLPTGYLYGRLDLAAGETLLAAARSGEMVADGCRGRSTWSPAGQVAELAVREASGDRRPDALTVVAEESPGDGEWRVQVTADDGRSWWVSGTRRMLTPPRPTSCAKDPVEPVANVVTDVRDAHESLPVP